MKVEGAAAIQELFSAALNPREISKEMRETPGEKIKYKFNFCAVEPHKICSCSFCHDMPHNKSAFSVLLKLC
jgi:hypothetical protein